MTDNDTSIDHGSRAHSRLVGGSKAARVIGCPASVLLCADEPDSTNDAAEAGTARHEAMEYWLTGDHPHSELDELAGMVFNRHEVDNDFLLDLQAANAAFEHFRSLCDHEGGLEYEQEQKVRIPLQALKDYDADEEDAAFGTLDLVGRTKKRTVIWDWKFGSQPVEVQDNKQLMFYAAGAYYSLPHMVEDDDDWPIELVICQPSAAEDGELCYQRYTTTLGSVLDFVETLDGAVREALGPSPERKRGPWCRFAYCKATCPLHLNPLQRMADLSDRAQALTAQREALPEDAPPEAVAEVEDQLALLYGTAMDLAEAIEPVVNAVKARVQERLEAGYDVHGWKLVPKRAMRLAFSDEDKAASLLRRLGLKKADMYHPPKLLSPAQAEKLLKVRKISMDDKQAEQFATLSPAVSSGHTVAPWDDNRPSVLPPSERVRELGAKLKALTEG